MPTYDGECPSCGTLYEFFVKSWKDANPPCPRCATPVKRMVCAPMPIDAHSEMFQDHYQWRRNDDGTQDRVLIDSREKQKAFCKQQGLYDPKELPDDMPQRLDEHGKVKKSRGSGQWI